MIKKSTIIFAVPDDDMAIDDAKKYIDVMNLTKNDVRIIKLNKQILVEAIRDI